MTAIEWTDETWNPVTGCDKVSPGCDNCYADRQARRLKAMHNPRYRNGFEVTLHHDKLRDPAKWRDGRKIFVNSMSDLFHPKVPFDFVEEVMATMHFAPQHDFQVLTKRPKTAGKWYANRGFGALPSNLWLGVSVEDVERKSRIDALRAIPAPIRFLSIEPLLEDLGDLDLEGIDWVIVGGESGPGCRPMEADWVRSVRDQCVSAGIAFFFKQWGTTNKRRAGRVLDGETWLEFPAKNPLTG